MRMLIIAGRFAKLKSAPDEGAVGDEFQINFGNDAQVSGKDD